MRVSHLSLGTQEDNVKDVWLRDKYPKGKGIVRQGVERPGHKLTDEQVISIRKDTRTHREIGISFGVHHSTVFAIKHERTWRHI